MQEMLSAMCCCAALSIVDPLLICCCAPQVAMRRRAAGKRDGVMAGETVPYVICLRVEREGQQHQPGSSTQSAIASPSAQQSGGEQEHQQPAGTDTPAVIQEGGDQQHPSPAPAAAAKGVKSAAGGGSKSGGLAERAYHPDELRSDPSLVIDAEYYLGQQVLPVVVRLCVPIEVGHAAQSLLVQPTDLHLSWTTACPQLICEISCLLPISYRDPLPVHSCCTSIMGSPEKYSSSHRVPMRLTWPSALAWTHHGMVGLGTAIRAVWRHHCGKKPCR